MKCNENGLQPQHAAYKVDYIFLVEIKSIQRGESVCKNTERAGDNFHTFDHC